ncbi:MAG: Hpt domain-containing protein [Candidatus Riflebacteria bacterium]|nr:Hpt domain-containing protein [Candidatus Riflebacteria bacterium]
MDRTRAEELIKRLQGGPHKNHEFAAGVSGSLTAVDSCDPLYREFFGDFYDEATGFVNKMTSYVAEFRNGSFTNTTIAEAFRLSHMVKGASATMGYKVITSLASGLESLFGDVRDGKVTLSPDLLDHVAETMGLISGHLEELKKAVE